MFFKIHTFRVPDLFDISQYVENRYQIDSVLAEKLAKQWLIGFCHNLCLFYVSQSRRYASFYEKYRRQDEPADMSRVWAEADFAAEQCKTLNSIKRKLQQDLDGGDFIAWYTEVFRMGVAGQIPPQLERELNARWFNKEIDRPPELVFELRRLPYRDYLNTPEWKHVRASLIMIRRARCQQELCYSSGESFSSDWEAELDVHHLSYGNLGHERYADLALLCKTHHEMWHENMRKTGHPGLRLFD